MMTTETGERREAFRISLSLDRRLSFSELGCEGHSGGELEDLSQNGVKFTADRRVDPGTSLIIRMKPDDVEREPVVARAVVVRCEELPGGRFEVACRLTGVE